MASRAGKVNTSIAAHPDWGVAQNTLFARIAAAVPIALGYAGNEIPVLDNHTNEQLVDETGALKQAKKIFDKAEKTHVERLKARIGHLDNCTGDAYVASFRGGSRVILNQEKCKEFIEECNQEGIHIGRLLEALKSGQLDLPTECILRDPVGEDEAGESNNVDFYTTSAGGRALYVEPI